MNTKTKAVDYRNVTLKGGFWADKQRLVRETTLMSVYNRFKETGRFAAIAEGDMPEGTKRHIFYDSDVAKWLESVGYVAGKYDIPDIVALADAAIDDIGNTQGEDGYFNSYFQLVEPEARWTRRTDHELYCAGHLIEAAIAYYYGTGKDKLLKIMCRYADYIYKVFVEERSAAFTSPGHEEIEPALVKLWKCTGNEKYLELSRFFINQRGTVSGGYYKNAIASYSQDHLPVREQTTAEGHSVRAVYLYSGMADIAYTDDDKALKEACRTIFDNISERRMYVTGGIGSSRVGEAFTIDYDLQNDTAYTETCAALGLSFFCERMTLLESDGAYDDVAERAIYNGFLSGLSLDGKAFFYENPLEIIPELHHRDKTTEWPGGIIYPITQRKEVFDCSCCPPNVTRFISNIERMLYSENEDMVVVHQFMPSEAKLECGTITTETDYPYGGSVKLHYEGEPRTLRVRVPGWCDRFTCDSANLTIAATRPKNGFIVLPAASVIDATLEFDMTPFAVEANPHVHADAGRICIQRGPLVYCAEAVDNGSCIRDLSIDTDAEIRFAMEGGLPILYAQGTRRNSFGTLYRRYDPTDVQHIQIRLIPYFAFANRGETEMEVWFTPVK